MAEDKKEDKKEDKGVEIDFGIGKFTLGSLFKGIERLIDFAAELKEAGGEMKKEGEIDFSHLKKGMKGVYGVSIKTATGGNPVVESFGNIKKTPKGPKIQDEREPLIDVFEEEDETLVIAEMPGVVQEDIKLDLKGDILEISAQTQDRKYYKEVLLHQKINKETLNFSCTNGILEVRIKK